MKYAGLIKHGCSRKSGQTDEYGIWLDMRKRCRNPSSSVWRYYGGRGISVCERWQDFSNFLADMGPRPSADHSIDRIDSDGNYEPSNCRWATRQQQMRNKRDNRLLTVDGITRCATEWAEVLGISVHTVRRRIRMGWSDAMVLSPPRPYRSKQ